MDLAGVLYAYFAINNIAMVSSCVLLQYFKNKS